MKKWDSKKLVVSTLIFLFTCMAFTPMPGEATGHSVIFLFFRKFPKCDRGHCVFLPPAPNIG